MKPFLYALTLCIAAAGAEVGDTTPLLRAAYQDNLELVRKLVREGDVNVRNRYGVTPLSVACANGNPAMAELLLEAGADPNAALPGGESPLMTAARVGKVRTVKALLERGADINAKDARRGQTALIWAAAEGHAEVVDVLIRAGADFRARIASGFTPMFFAVRDGRLAVVRTLIERGADVNETFRPSPVASGRRTPPTGISLLGMAVENGHFELAMVLVEAGADPNVFAPGFTPLHAISWVRKTSIGDDHDPVPVGTGNLTSIEFVKKIVARGAGVNALVTRHIRGLSRLNTLGATPFFLASRTADVELMRVLLELGANPNAANADGTTPLMAAAGLGTQSPGEDPGTPLECMEAVKLILSLGADVNAVDKNGETALHAAAYKNLPEMVEYLVSKGADIRIWHRQNKYGWTPLTIAMGYRFGNYKPSPDTVSAFHRVMLAAGVDPATNPKAPGREVY
jgi:ankyrin repeat protein